MSVFDGLDSKAVAELAREDFCAARDSRQEIELRKLGHYKLYRLWRDELPDGGKGDDAPFQWSKLSVPIVFARRA